MEFPIFIDNENDNFFIVCTNPGCRTRINFDPQGYDGCGIQFAICEKCGNEIVLYKTRGIQA